VVSYLSIFTSRAASTPAKRGDVGGNSVEKRQHMAGASIVAHPACLLQPYDQAAQVGGIAPSSLDRFAKSGDARNPPIGMVFAFWTGASSWPPQDQP
jgi:hypothetical protein